LPLPSITPVDDECVGDDKVEAFLV
jgi:hypothetical protein